MNHVMAVIVAGVTESILAYLIAGILVALMYALNWKVIPRFSHMVAWPIVLGYMLQGRTLPDWLRPAPKSIF